MRQVRGRWPEVLGVVMENPMVMVFRRYLEAMPWVPMEKETSTS